MYQITILEVAQENVKSIDKPFRLKIYDKIFSLGSKPHPVGSIKLTNSEVYRIRIGDYRVLYEIDENNKKIEISRIKHRKDAYK